MAEIDILRVIGPGAAGDDDIFRAEGFGGVIAVVDLHPVFIDEAGLAGINLAVVALVKTLAHVGLLLYDLVGMTQNIGEAGVGQAGITVQRALINFNNPADRLTQRFGGNGCPSGCSRCRRCHSAQ